MWKINRVINAAFVEREDATDRRRDSRRARDYKVFSQLALTMVLLA